MDHTSTLQDTHGSKDHGLGTSNGPPRDPSGTRGGPRPTVWEPAMDPLETLQGPQGVPGPELATLPLCQEQELKRVPGTFSEAGPCEVETKPEPKKLVQVPPGSGWFQNQVIVEKGLYTHTYSICIC